MGFEDIGALLSLYCLQPSSQPFLRACYTSKSADVCGKSSRGLLLVPTSWIAFQPGHMAVKLRSMGVN